MRTRLLPLAAVLPLLAGAPACAGVVAGPAAPTVAGPGAPTVAGPAAPTVAATGPCGTRAVAPGYRHVIWIWMENHSYSTIIGSPSAPYINSLAGRCGLATNYHNVSHPSLPNYVSATSGLGYSAIARFNGDCNPVPGCVTSAASIFGQGETWRAYEQSMPSTCPKTNSGEYAVRHNPPPYFIKLRGCGTFDVPYARLAKDLSAGKLPAFSFITPNLIDDMHDGTVADGDKWLAANLPTILTSPEYTSGSTAVFITWDEGEGGTATQCAANKTDVGCHVATIVVSPSTRPGTRSATLFNHYSLLGTAEQLLGLPALGKAASFPTMTSAFHL
jgi:phosphatidylinositol-3-phosphatase